MIQTKHDPLCTLGRNMEQDAGELEELGAAGPVPGLRDDQGPLWRRLRHLVHPGPDEVRSGFRKPGPLLGSGHHRRHLQQPQRAPQRELFTQACFFKISKITQGFFSKNNSSFLKITQDLWGNNPKFW